MAGLKQTKELKKLLELKKRLQTKDAENFRRKLLPMFRGAIKNAYETYAQILKTETVSMQDDTIASGRLLKAFNKDVNTAVSVSKSRMYFRVGIRTGVGGATYSDPSEYYDVIDNARNRSAEDSPTVERILKWMKDRKIISSVSDRVPLGNKGFTVPAKEMAAMIVNRIQAKTARGEYKSLELTAAIVNATGWRNPDSDLRQKVRGFFELIGPDAAPF